MDTQKDPSFTPTARLLLDAFRAFENELTHILDSKGFPDVTRGNLNVLRHLNPEGMHLSALAKDAKISKQAIGKMVKDLEYKGYVELIPDKTDARAKFVRHTRKGKKFIDLAIVAVFEMEDEYRFFLGKKNYDNFRHSINQILHWHLNKKEK